MTAPQPLQRGPTASGTSFLGAPVAAICRNCMVGCESRRGARMLGFGPERHLGLPWEPWWSPTHEWPADRGPERTP